MSAAQASATRPASAAQASAALTAHHAGGPATRPQRPGRHHLSPRARRDATQTAHAPITGDGPVNTYVTELDLTPIAAGPRAAVLGTVTRALLAAVRRVHAITDVEVIFADRTVLIPRAHDLTRDAIATRITTPGDHTRAGTAHIAILDQSTTDGTTLHVAGPTPGQLLSATLGHIEPRPFAHPGPTGHPDISFRSTALFALSCRSSEIDAPHAAAVISAVAAQLHAHESAS